MDPAYYVAAGSLNARSLQLEVLANNLANANTVGYKSERSFFQVFNKAAQSSRGLARTRDGSVATTWQRSCISFVP
jgi:flagellar basal-body rod protein FlgB